MRALILAAGRGTRLDPLTRDRPKPLLEVAGRPILEHCLERLAPFRPDEVRMVVGWRGERIRDRFGSVWRGVPLRYVQQDEPLGLAHAVAVGGAGIEEPFLAMHGDAVFGPAVDLRPVVQRFEAGDGGPAPPPAALLTGRSDLVERTAASLLTERRDPSELTAGAVRVEGGRAIAFAEDPSPEEKQWGRVAAGFYLFDPVVIEACRAIQPSARGEYELADALAWLLGRGWAVLASDLAGERVNVNTPADLARAERLAGDTSR